MFGVPGIEVPTYVRGLGSENSRLIQVKPPADVTDFERS